MRVIAKRTLRQFWERPGREDAELPLKAWHALAQAAAWSSPADIKAQFRSASLLGGNRVVFNIAGNKYRLVARIDYRHHILFVRFVGTHGDYDRIDAETI